MTRRRVGLTLEIVFPLVVLGVWAAISGAADFFFFPPLSEVLSTFRETWLFERASSDMLPSLRRLGLGYAIAVVVGVGLGILLGWYRTAGRLADPLVEFMRALPATVLLPLGIMILGVGETMKVLLIALGSVFPILLNTIDGVRGVDPVLLDTASTLRVRGRRRLTHIALPAAMPQIMTGARISLSVAFIVMVSAELLASDDGIGRSVLVAQRSFLMSEMWAGIILLGVLGYLFNAAFSVLEWRLLRWHRGARASVERDTGIG